MGNGVSVTRSHSGAQLLAEWALACRCSIHFDHRLISALLIKFSICFIVNEVRQAGTKSHSGRKNNDSWSGTREQKRKEW